MLVVCSSARVDSGSEREKAQDQAGAEFVDWLVNGWSDELCERRSRQRVARCRWQVEMCLLGLGAEKEKAPHDSGTDYRPGRWAGSVYQE